MGNRDKGEKYCIDFLLEEGKFSGYRLLMEQRNLDRHWRTHPNRWYYSPSARDQYFNEIIPKTFEISDCICPSNSGKRNMYCIYRIVRERGSYKEYIKIPFYINRIRKKIKIYTYIRIPTISEELCRQKMKK